MSVSFLQRLFSLKPKDYLLLTESWLTLAWVDLMISFSPYPRWRHWMESAEPDGVNHKQTFDVSFLINHSESVARHHVRAMNCLRRTLAQKLMLARRGIVARVHIGVKKDDAGFAAHSWLSYENKILNDSPDVVDRYVELEKSMWRGANFFSN